MWVVYKWEDYEGSFGHRYFNEEANAIKYLRKLVAQGYSKFEIEEIETED